MKPATTDGCLILPELVPHQGRQLLAAQGNTPTPRHKRQINKRKAVLVTNTQICLWKLHKDMKLKEVNRPESFYIF